MIHIHAYMLVDTYINFSTRVSTIDDVYLKNITTRVSQNLILHKSADHPKA
jgi:hypothetical protein